MGVLGGVIGAVLGFIIVIVIAEWQWVNWFGRHDTAEGALMVLFVGGGAFVGSRLGPRFRRQAH